MERTSWIAALPSIEPSACPPALGITAIILVCYFRGEESVYRKRQEENSTMSQVFKMAHEWEEIRRRLREVKNLYMSARGPDREYLILHVHRVTSALEFHSGQWSSGRSEGHGGSGRDHSREGVILRTGVVSNAERHPDGGWVTRVWLSQNHDLGVGRRDVHVGWIAMFDVCAPVSAGSGGDGQIVEDGAQRDHGAFFFFVKSLAWNERRGRDRR